MNLLPLARLGASGTLPSTLSFGLYLPGVTAAAGFAVTVKAIHEDDQFIQSIPPFEYPLANAPDALFPNGDYWSVQVNTAVPPPGVPLPAGAHWGQQGRYVYRYVVTKPGPVSYDFVIDPYAREYGVGDLSAVTLGYIDHPWSAHEAQWQTPALQDLICYELMIDEFGGDLDGATALLDYLKDLGINAIEVMPVNNVKNTLNWGYDPIGYFGVDDRFGKRSNFQAFVDEAHQRGIAVLLDVVYGHTTGEFTFPYLYPNLGVPNPFNGPQIKAGDYGPMPDFTEPFTLDYFYTTNYIWLDRFHVDGFRYDNVPAFWDSPTPGAKYGALVQETYNLVRTSATPGAVGVNYWNRFIGPGGSINLIQCAEYLDDPPAVLNNTVTNCTWQDLTFNAAKHCAAGNGGAISELGRKLGLQYFPTVVTTGGVTVQKTALQYIENHDHSRFICEFGLDTSDDMLMWEGQKQNWYKLQPYLIGLLMAKGVPMLWEGEEFLQTYFVPDVGRGRPYLFRPVDFSSFYSAEGKSLIGKVRRLIEIRKGGAQFTRGDHFFYDDPYYTNNGLLVFSRSLNNVFSFVALNFTGTDRSTTLQFPTSGNYVEEIDGLNNLNNVAANAPTPVTIPSNYGQIWTR